MNDQQQSRADGLNEEQREALEWAADRAHVASLGKPVVGIESRRHRALRDLLDASAKVIPEGCTPSDARMLREANHALAAENDALRRVLRPFARVVSTDKLSWAMVEYCVEGDPEKQTFQAPQMQRAFNRAADMLRNESMQPTAGSATNACKRCGSSTAQACNDVGCFYLESGDGEPPAAPADERAELERLRNGLENCIENARLRNDAYDVGYMTEMLNSLKGILSRAAASPAGEWPTHDEARRIYRRIRAQAHRNPIGYIEADELEKLGSPEFADVPENHVRLWHPANPPSRALIPVYCAPQKTGEPFGWISRHDFEIGDGVALVGANTKADDVPLYTAPQPAQADARRALTFDQWWSTGGCRLVSQAGDKNGWRGAAEAGYIGGLFSVAASVAQADAPAEAREPIGPHDLSTSAGGRGYVAEFFAKRLRRHDFARYITGQLAADFACALAAYLRDHDRVPADAGEARLTDAARDVLAERRRQVEQEGWTPAHDDEHDMGEMAHAAAWYSVDQMIRSALDERGLSFWPWAQEWWKPTTPRRDLVKAGALILAELERLDRAALLNGADHDR